MQTNEFSRNCFPVAVQNYEPEIGLILGSGLGGFVDLIERDGEVSFSDVPGIPRSTVPGHAGCFVFGRIGSRRLMIAQGRVHLYEGRTAYQVASIVRAMAAFGIRHLVLTNAAGCANPEFRPGHWMQISDHVNLLGESPLSGGPNFFDMTNLYDAEQRLKFRHVAADLGIDLFEGVYAAVPGPQYETPAEVRMLQRLGADAIGMSTVPEAIQARALGITVSGFSCLTNWAAGITGEALSHQEVLETGRRASTQLMQLLAEALVR